MNPGFLKSQGVAAVLKKPLDLEKLAGLVKQLVPAEQVAQAGYPLIAQ